MLVVIEFQGDFESVYFLCCGLQIEMFFNGLYFEFCGVKGFGWYVGEV